MYVECKSSDLGQFWFIIFENNDEKRRILNDMRLASDNLSELGKQKLYDLIHKISSRCKHNDTCPDNDEIVSYIFQSEVDNVVMFMMIFSSYIQKLNDICDIYKDIVATKDEQLIRYRELMDLYTGRIKDYEAKYGEIITDDIK